MITKSPLLSVLFLVVIVVTFFVTKSFLYLAVISLLWFLAILLFTTTNFLAKASIPFTIFVSTLLLVSTGIIYVGSNAENNLRTEMTPTLCKPIYEEYHNTIIDISSTNLFGTVGIQINPDDCRATVNYNLRFDEELSKNQKTDDVNYSVYRYAGGMRKNGMKREDNIGTGEIFPVYLNRELLPESFSFGVDIVDYETNKMYYGESTKSFYQGWSTSFLFNENSLDNILARDLYEVVDGAPYVLREEHGGTYGYTMDSNKASVEGDIVKSFRLEYQIRE